MAKAPGWRHDELTFNRQKPIGKYVVDFYCKPLSLVIEVDGGYHCEPEQRVADEQRQQRLEEMGLNFLRFSEQQVLKDMDRAINAIKNYVVAFEHKNHISSLAT